jgi:hypothetical protein
VNDESVDGAELTVELYEYDPSVSVQTSLPLLLEVSENYTLVASDLGSWVTLKLDNPTPVYPSLSPTSTVGYLAAVHGIASPVDTSIISTSGNEGVVSYIQDNGCNICATPPCTFGTWYGLGNTLMIRMNLGDTPIPSSIDENVFNGKLTVYPNPSKGIFNIDLVDVKNGDYLISVSNILGEEVYFETREVNSTTSTTINLSDLESGIYILDIQNGDLSISRKLIIE